MWKKNGLLRDSNPQLSALYADALLTELKGPASRSAVGAAGSCIADWQRLLLRYGFLIALGKKNVLYKRTAYRLCLLAEPTGVHLFFHFLSIEQTD